MCKTKIIAGILLVFILGAAAGTFGTKVYFKHRIEQYSRSEKPPLVRMLVNRLSSKLDLTESQEQEVKQIVMQTVKDVRALRNTYRPQMEEIFRQTLEQIRKHLTEDQKKKLDEYCKEGFFAKGCWHSHQNFYPTPAEGFVHRFISTAVEALLLTEEQRMQVEDIMVEHLARYQELLQTHPKSGPETSKLLGQHLQELNRDTEARLQRVLTDEQMQKYRMLWDEQRRELWDLMASQSQTDEAANNLRK
ncbi:MAG TPA: hypothetical protein PLG17_07330 [Thermodesulfobacteriota bacterium]|nr:hypothetical protein [Deltaproteobacteria bacterium]HNR11739.1 hypothetical protein [Thermodesulfobacteriota bacterium]HNU70186.1 hypothetical protein [Thermodesulfobacteriota bacterium]HQO78308.1 hypothetical protein [Thermodesulfobacteriota bacterium]